MMLNFVYVFNFHRISDESSPAYLPMPLKVFESVLCHLKRRYTIVPQQSLIEKEKINTKKTLLVITFDDAYLDFLEYALPILQKHHIYATEHVITSCAETGKTFWTQQLNKTIETYWTQQKVIEILSLKIKTLLQTEKEVEPFALQLYLKLLNREDKQEIVDILTDGVLDNVTLTPMMKWSDLKSIPQSLISIGSHTHTHQNLCTLSEQTQRQELKQSFALIYQHLSVVPISIAYPNGQYNREINVLAKEIGYQLAYSCDATKNPMQQQFLFHRANLYHQHFWKNYLRLFLLTKHL